MDKAKAIKKYVLQNRWSMQEICHMVGVTMAEAAELYKGYTGKDLPPGMFVVGHDDTINTIQLAIKQHKHVLLHGEPGIGKTASATFAIREAGKIMRKINLSDKRTGTLLANTLFGAHRTPSDVVFLFDEADNFHWRSHVYFKKVLDESQVSIIMTCNNVSKIPKTIMSMLKKEGKIIKMYPPSIDDFRQFMEQSFPDRVHEVPKLYDEDFRVVIRRLLHGYSGTYMKEIEITAEGVAGAVFGDRNVKRRLGRIMKSKDPLAWVTTWLDYNCARFFRKPEELSDFLRKLAKIDRWVYRTNKQFLATMFAALPSPGRRSALKFPAALFNSQRKHKKEDVEEIKKVTPAPVAKKKEVVVGSTSVDPFDF